MRTFRVNHLTLFLTKRTSDVDYPFPNIPFVRWHQTSVLRLKPVLIPSDSYFDSLLTALSLPIHVF